MIASPLEAQPVPREAQEEQDSSEGPAKVVFASADDAETPQDDREQQEQPQTSRPKPHGAARVTTCRCGDPQHN